MLFSRQKFEREFGTPHRNRFIVELWLRWIIYLATEVFFIAKLRSSKLNLLRGTQSANFPRASPILCLVFAKVLALVYHNPHTYTEFVVAQALLSREDTRAYFVGSGPRHYFEIHEVEWRNRVRTKFRMAGKRLAEGWPG